MADWEEHRILIWGKTYPELSEKYQETVCTGGTLESGKFVRIYPIPLRYMDHESQFKKYQWITAKIKKSSEDPRPESYKVDINSIIIQEVIAPDKFQWNDRRLLVFKDQSNIFNSVSDLYTSREIYGTSIGFVKPKEIKEIYSKERNQDDYLQFLEKFKSSKEKKNQTSLFDQYTFEEIQDLQFLRHRIKVRWVANDNIIHDMSILDWEVCELMRKVGVAKTIESVKVHLDLKVYDAGFFLGNFRKHPNRFGIGAIWYPKKSNLAPNIKLDF